MRALVCVLVIYITLTYVSVWVSDILPLWDHWFGTPWGLFKLFLYNYLVLHLAINYYLVCNRTPGFVPSAWHPPGMSQEQLDLIKTEHVTSRHAPNPRSLRYCRYCQCFKPPNAHHCSQCRACVLRKDHHCPWVNNCVGLYNHKHFVLFILYATLACSFSIAIHIATILAHIQANSAHPSSSSDIAAAMTPLPSMPAAPSSANLLSTQTAVLTIQRSVILAVSLFLLIPVTLALLSLVIWQLMLLVNDQTTVEAELEIYSPASGKSSSTSSPFGILSCISRSLVNLSIVFGPPSVDWVLPTTPSIRSPIHSAIFATRDLDV